MRILWDNLWDLYSLTESDEDISYPATNTQDIRLAKVWRTATVASVVTVYVDAGSGETITCNCAAIVNHNITPAGTAAVQANSIGITDVDFDDGSVNSIITHRDDIMVVFFTEHALRYWRFKIEDVSNTNGYLEMGRLFLGTYLQVDPSSLVEFPQEQVRTDNVQFSRDGQLYADEGICYKQVRYQFQEASASAKTLIETMWAGSAGVGKHKPIILLNYDETFTVIEPLYCAIAEDIVFKHKTHDYWDFDLVLRECR